MRGKKLFDRLQYFVVLVNIILFVIWTLKVDKNQCNIPESSLSTITKENLRDMAISPDQRENERNRLRDMAISPDQSENERNRLQTTITKDSLKDRAVSPDNSVTEGNKLETTVTKDSLRGATTSQNQTLNERSIHESVHDNLKKTFKIIVWYKYQNYILRHVTGSPREWSVDNCHFTRDRKQMDDSQAVVIPMEMYTRFKDLPKTRSPSQRWIMLYDDFPAMLLEKEGWSSGAFKNMFNWTMTYLLDSDIPIPYGWMEKMETPIVSGDNFANAHRNDSVLVAAAVSNCRIKNHRLDYIKELKKHVSLDFYGKCGDKKCKGERFLTPCAEIKDHKFFLAFENSNCREYITEKLWLHGYGKNVIPIVMGPPKHEYLAVAPPHSFIHVDDFESPKALANFVQMLDKNDTAYNEYFKWKESYTIHVRQQFLGMRPWKLLCDKLNAVDDTDQKVYDDVAKWFNKEEMCPAERQI